MHLIYSSDFFHYFSFQLPSKLIYLRQFRHFVTVGIWLLRWHPFTDRNLLFITVECSGYILDVMLLIFKKKKQFLHSCCVPTPSFLCWAGRSDHHHGKSVRTFPNCIHRFLICYPVITPSPYCCVIRQSISTGETCFTIKQKTKSLYELLRDTKPSTVIVMARQLIPRRASDSPAPSVAHCRYCKLCLFTGK